MLRKRPLSQYSVRICEYRYQAITNLFTHKVRIKFKNICYLYLRLHLVYGKHISFFLIVFILSKILSLYPVYGMENLSIHTYRHYHPTSRHIITVISTSHLTLYPAPWPPRPTQSEPVPPTTPAGSTNGRP